MDNFRDFVVKHLGFEKLFHKVFDNAIVTSLLKLLPALAEITFLGRVFYMSELAKNHNFDLVIVDGFASGHFYDLLTTPEAVIRSGIVGPVLKETQRIEKFFADPKICATVLVATPQPLVISECLEFIPKLSATGLCPVNKIFLNRVPPLTLSEEGEKNAALAFSKIAEKQYLEAVESLRLGLTELQNKFRSLSDFFQAPDLGFIQEPLPKNFYRQLLGNV